MKNLILIMSLIVLVIFFTSCSRKSDLVVDIDVVKKYTLNKHIKFDNATVEVIEFNSKTSKKIKNSILKNIKADIESDIKNVHMHKGNDLLIQVIIESLNYGASGTVKYFDNKKNLLSEIDIFIDPKFGSTRILADVNKGFSKEVVTYTKKYFLKIKKD